MVKTYGTLLRLILLTGCLGIVSLFADDASGAAASLSNFALPEYSKSNGRLQFILYGEKATNLGAMIMLVKPKIDIVKDDMKNIRDIVSLAEAEPYPLTFTPQQVMDYWKDKQHSQSLIFSDDAEYDKNLRMLRSDAPVHFRSREISVDGVGFDADQDRRFIHIRSKVRMVIYPEMRKYSGMRPLGENNSQDNSKKETNK